MSEHLRDIHRRRDRRGARDPEGKAALFSTPAQPSAGTVVVACSECGAQTPLSYGDFIVANLPVAVWLPPIPGLRFNRRMTCPACRQWTWMRARWLP